MEAGHQRSAKETAVREHLEEIVPATTPDVVYLHTLANKHDTHVAVALRSIAALRAVRREVHPKQVYGCEVWRDLDWLVDEDKQVLPGSERSNIAAALVGVFDSQGGGGERRCFVSGGRPPGPA